jgi:raffinose/stachyose/melibiose transport system permease protein
MESKKQKKMRRAAIRRSRRDMPASMRVSSALARVLGNGLMFLYSISCIYPAIWLIYSSMKSMGEFSANAISLPAAPSLKHYQTILLETSMPMWLVNTARTTVLSLAFILLFGFVIGYFLSRFKFRGRNFLYGYFMLGILVPIHALMVPMYILFRQTNLVDTWYSLLFPYVSFGLPIAIFLMESATHSIPKEVEEAAAIDGASFSRTLFRIIFPMSVPILVTIGIIQFFTCWNEFSFALILINNQNLLTVPVGLTLFKGQYATDYPKMMTAMVVAMLPAIILYFAFSKQIIKGMVAGAVKG